MVKLVHGILPINSKLHRNDMIRSLCPCCKVQKENWPHVLRCAAPSQTEWRTNMLTAIDQKCESLRTHPTLRHTLITAITNWTTWDMDDQEFTYESDPSYITSQRFVCLIAQQNVSAGTNYFWDVSASCGVTFKTTITHRRLISRAANADPGHNGKRQSSAKSGRNGLSCGR